MKSNNLNNQKNIDNQIVLCFTLIGVTINTYLDYQEQKSIKERNPYYEYDYFRTFKNALIGGGLGFGVGYLFCGVRNYFLDTYDKVTPIDENEYLKEVLHSYEYDEDFDANIKAQNVINQLYNHFYEKLEDKPEYQGSLAKGTANQGLSDCDIALRFKEDSFSNLEEMNDAIYSFFNCLDDIDLIKVRQQQHSIGVVFNSTGQDFRLDVVSRKKQRMNDAYSIYVASKSMFKKSTYRKTNTKTHENFGSFAKSKKEITRLLKINKEVDNLPLKGFLLERLVINAIDKHLYNLPKKRFDRLKLVVDEIANQICQVNIKDPSNSNNILTSYLTDNEKTKIFNHFIQLSLEIEYDSKVLRRFFPKMNN